MIDFGIAFATAALDCSSTLATGFRQADGKAVI
jgi:hypothetical protein